MSGVESVQEAYDQLAEAILDEDATATQSRVLLLVEALAALGPDGLAAAEELGNDLLDGWIELDGDDERAQAVRELIVVAMVGIADTFPAPLFAGAYEQAGLTVVDDDPAQAARHFRRAAELADDVHERVGYQIELVMALADSGQIADALLCLDAVELAADDTENRNAVLSLRLRLAAESEPEAACREALSLLGGNPDDLADDIGEAAMYALLMEASRQEAAGQPVEVDIHEGLRIGLGRPAWAPEPLSTSDFALAVAWLDFARDDTVRFRETMTRVTGPLSNADMEARAAILRISLAVLDLDPIKIEAVVREAAPLVERCSEPGVRRAYNYALAQVARARGERVEIGDGDDLDLARLTRLYDDCMDASDRARAGDPHAFSADLCARIDAWCDSLDDDSPDVGMGGLALLFGSLSAAASEDWALYSERSTRLLSVWGGRSDQPSQQWFALMAELLRPMLSGAHDRGLAVVRAASQRARELDYRMAAYLSDIHLSMIAATPPDEALAAGARALQFRQRQLASLAGSTERLTLRAFENDLTERAMRAAARIADPRVLAELLEVLRAQELPDPGDADKLPPLAALALDLNRGQQPIRPREDSVIMALPDPVLMPWGRVALAGHATPEIGRAPVVLCVPILPG